MFDELAGELQEMSKKQKPAPQKPDKPPEQPEPETDPEKRTEQPQPDKPGKPAGEGIKTLRTSYETAKKRVAELEQEVKTLREAKPREDPAELLSQLESANKRAEEAETELKFTRYEKSREYHDKYVAPMEKIFKRAYGDVTQLTMTDPETGDERPAKKEDFDTLMRLPLGEARKFAKQFGDEAEELMSYRREILQLHESSKEAIQEFRANGANREKEMSAKSQAEMRRQAEAFNKQVQTDQEKYPDWFKEVEGDQAGNALLKRGTDLAAKLFGDNSNMEPAEKARFHAAVFNQIRAFPRMTMRVHKLTNRVKELEEALAQYEDSGPSGGARKTGGDSIKAKGGKAAEGTMEAAEEELRSLA